MNLLPPCRFSGADDLEPVMYLGETPVADRLLDRPVPQAESSLVPLQLAFSDTSKLLQLTHTVPATLLYNENYPYFSSVSPALLQHFRTSAGKILEKKQPGHRHLVIEAASNDGYMLQNFVSRNIPVLGIEPARKQAEIARQKNIPTLDAFFTRALAESLAADGRMADIFIANNVLAHAEDLNDFVAGMAILLKEDGLAVVEVPYVMDMIGQGEFDTVYHQHIYYFSLTSLLYVFNTYNLHVNHVERLDIHGGSLRFYVQKHRLQDKSVELLLEEENVAGIENTTYYRTLETRAGKLKQDLTSLLDNIKSRGERIAAYGAAAKATTFMSYMELDNSIIDYVVDRNPVKHGKYMPGNLLEIFDCEKLVRDNPDYTLVLAWNFANEIMTEMEKYRSNGGRFIIPIPELMVA